MGSTPVGIYSASGISAILGMNPYSTRLHAWQNIMERLRPGFNAEKGCTLPEFPDNPPIRWGHGFESAGIELAEAKEGLNIINREKLHQKEFGDVLLTCHVDGEYEQSRPYVLHEFKTTWSRAFYSVKGEDCEIEDCTITEYKRRWGDPGTEETPVEYQIQAAVQRICTGAELVKLSVLVFPKSTTDWDHETGGDWEIKKDETGYFIESYPTGAANGSIIIHPIEWAKPWAQQGNFHTYNLPTNKKLESLIIEKVQEFDEKYVKTELPPQFESYADVRRILTTPMGTVIATPEMSAKAAEYSELVRILGAKSPHKKRQEALKVEIMTWMNEQRKDDWSVPSDKMCLTSPDGGESLITFSKSGFRGKRA
jgi:hypothetical protein